MRLRRSLLNPATVLIGQLFLSGVSAAQETKTPGGAPQAPAEPVAGAAAEEVVGGAEVAGKKKATEEITVTGSRIRRKDLTTAAPVTVISREQVVASGKVSIGDFLQSLPEQGNAINTQMNNGGNGGTRISLRGLGDQRTLVLLNGRRFVPGGTGADSSVDLNSIPTSAIERIEILKDGASAVYGSDAIAGVVNIITRKSYNATEAAVFAGRSQPHGDGTSYDVNLTTGTSGDRGSLTFSAGFYTMQPVMAGDRAFSAIPVAYDATGKNGGPNGQPGIYTQGSGTIPAGRIILGQKDPGKLDPNQPASALYNQLMVAYPKTRSFIFDPLSKYGWRPYAGASLAPAGDGYNFQPDNYLVTPQRRISLFTSGETRVGSFSQAFFEASFVNRQSDQKLAAEPLLTDQEGIVVSRYNAYNPFGRDFDPNVPGNGAGLRRRLNEFGTRTYNQDIDTFHLVAGLNGTLPSDFGPLHGWFWEIAANYGRTQADQLKRGNLRVSALQNAVGPSDPTGTKCLTAPGGAVIPNCVPLNLFGGGDPASITDAQIAGLTFTGTQRGINQIVVGTANVSGELFPLFGDRPVGLALGYEYRNLYGATIPDPFTVAGEATGNKGLITQGRYYTNEGYGELSIPILANLPFVEALEATAAARVFNYSNFGSDWTYKLGGRWHIIPDVTLRGTYSTAFRAPSISDLYQGQQDSFPNVKDPCRNLVGVDPNSTLYQTCVARGVPPGGSADTQSQLRSRVGGNPDLKPEKAKIFTVGAVFEPTIVRNLSVTVDYYNLTLDQPITAPGVSAILNGCYNSGISQLCDMVLRNSSGVINSILNINTNVGKEQTDGIDVAVRYAVPTADFGRFNFVFDGTWLHKYDRTLADGTTIRGKGTFDLATNGTYGVYPAIKFNTGASWSLSGFTVGGSTRFIGSFTECGDKGGDFSGGGLCYIDSTNQRRVGAYNTYDVFVSYALASSFGKSSLTAGVLNVGDRKPQRIYNGFTAASDPSAYDFMGRYPYLRASHSF
jgi:outer membrane receptor protein involved in Fe transport